MLVEGREVGGNMDQLREVGHFGEEVGREINDVLEESFRLLVELAALFGGGAKHREGVVSAAVVERLKQERDVIVQQVVRFAEAAEQHVVARR